MEDTSVWVKILILFSSAMTAVAVFLMKHVFNKHNDLFTNMSNITKEHADFRLNVSENYAKKSDVNAARLETNASLERIHLRLDSILELVKK